MWSPAAGEEVMDFVTKKDKGKGRQKEEENEEALQSHSPERPRTRGWSIDKMLTPFSKKRTPPQQERLRISAPILDPDYPAPGSHLGHLIPLGSITPTHASPTFLSTPRWPEENSPPTAPGPPPYDRRDLVRSYSARNLADSYHTVAHAGRKVQNLSDPEHLHAFPRPSQALPQHVPSNLKRRNAVRRKTGSRGSESGPLLSLGSPIQFKSSEPVAPPPTPQTTQSSPVFPRHSTRGSPLLSIQAGLEVASQRLSNISEASQEPGYNPVPTYTPKLSPIMDRQSLQPPSNAGTKFRAVQQAKDTEKLVTERAKRSGDEPPPYEFLELIGKGAYGRVFKGRGRNTGSLVAIKIIDTDKTDYEEMTTKNLQETLREINILQQLKDSKARPYVNIIEEARTVHNELWIISEYASGGSVNTLMKPRMNLPHKGLEEKFIVPIARELALGLKFIHEAGVIHRDLKSNNILILEDGRVQLCDFGVSGAVEPDTAKRSTIVGTPHWMAPELKREWVKDLDHHSRVPPKEILYGSEVDIWAYGCTIYEMATGLPPFHTTKPFMLPDAGVLQLEGDQYSDELKSLISFVMQPNPQERPNADMILEHEYLLNSTKMFPTVTLVALVEQYYRWEQAGGSRVSLFNPFGAQAPDPLAPEPESEDEDWTFSTSDEFERRHSIQDYDPFSSNTSVQDFTGMTSPPEDDSRFAKLQAEAQAELRAEQAERGQQRLNRLFDPSSKPYRYSTFEPDNQRPQSDLVLRDFQPGPPNRETVIDLDFAAPTIADVPSIDEVPTVKANRLNRLMRDMDLENDEPEQFDMDQMDQTARRDTSRETMAFSFPMAPAPPPEDEQVNNDEPSRRDTLGWKFPTQRPNRMTMEWTFSAAGMAEDPEPMPIPPLAPIPRPRDTQDSLTMRPADANRRTQNFVFPARDPDEGVAGPSGTYGLSSSPAPSSGFRPSLRHAATAPLESFDDFPRISSVPDSPVRSSMIDLDDAYVEDFRPSTAGSASTSTYTTGDQSSGNPFDLEDQVHLSESNNRTSFHMKSQSEPNHPLAGLLTPQTYDDEGYPLTQDPHNPNMHARGVSSASQMQQQHRPPPQNMPYRQRMQQPQSHAYYEEWSHQAAFSTANEQSPEMAGSPSISPDDEPTDVRARMESIMRQAGSQHRQSRMSNFRSRRNISTDEDHPRSDADDNYASESYDEFPTTSTSRRRSHVAVSAQGTPEIRLQMPTLDVAALADPNPDFEQLLLHSTTQAHSYLTASIDLMRSMRLREIVEEDEEEQQ